MVEKKTNEDSYCESRNISESVGEKLQYSREMKFLGLFLEAVASLGLVVSLSQSVSQSHTF